jgi:ATP-dependent DNA helicase RecG
VHYGTSEDASARITVMCETNDGFRIAEEDLALRGPGELFGRKQSGLQGFRFGDLRRDAALLERARDAARVVIASDPELQAEEHAVLRGVIQQREAGAFSIVKEEAG